MRGRVDLEVCVDGPDSLHAACAGGADRIELCSSLASGGLTPSPGLMRMAAELAVPVFAMIRPRAGDFRFSLREEEVMRRDIEAAADAGLAGVVLGAMGVDGRLDCAMLERLRMCAASAGVGHVTLHRVCDLVRDPEEALERAVDLGFERMLTSGGARTAPEGVVVLRRLRERADGRISVMAGSGVTPETAGPLVAATGVGEVHGSCRGVAPLPDGPGYGRRPAVTEERIVRAMRRVLDDAAAF